MKPDQMRIGGHRRWCIENNGFKDLNRHIQSKRYWTHDQKVRLKSEVKSAFDSDSGI